MDKRERLNLLWEASLKILILGGTTFLGPHLVYELQQHGHQFTLFNRGNQTIHFLNVEQLRGNRKGEIEVLKKKKWDVVIDYFRTSSKT